MNKILYLGDFQLPDKNAAAQRVVTVSKLLSKLEKEIILYGVSQEKVNKEKKKIKGTNIYYYEKEKSGIVEKIKEVFTIPNEILLMKKIKNLNMVICYNYHSVNLLKIRKYCKKNNIKLVADVTEWYDKSTLKFPLNVIKNCDTALRMKYINKKLDSLLCISEFLVKYYKNQNCCYLPAMLDISEEKWKRTETNLACKKKIIISFIGNPGNKFEKERLDLVIKAVQQYNQNSNKKIIFKIIGVTERILENTSIRLKNVDDIIFMGKVNHLVAIEELKKSDFSIIPRENKINILAGFPTKLGESFCCGVPVIVTKIGEMEKYIANEKNGFIIEKFNIEGICDIFKKIEKLTLDELNELKENAYNSRKKLDYNNYIEELKKIF